MKTSTIIALVFLLLAGCASAPTFPAEPTPGAPQTGILQAQCNSGDMESCLILNSLYSNDKTAQAQVRSAQIYDKPCEADLSPDCEAPKNKQSNVGSSAQEKNAEIQKLEQACQVSDSEACLSLALIYYAGEGVPQNFERGTQFLKPACHANVPTACVLLGIAYFQGKGVPQDNQRATELFHSECDTGNTLACEYIENPQHPDLTQ